MGGMLVVVPADPLLHEAVRQSPDSPLGRRVMADLVRCRNEVDERFPAGVAVGVTGALAARPEIVQGELCIRPEIAARPLVLFAVMSLAAPLQLAVRCSELEVVADPRHRLDIDVHRVAEVSHSDIGDHAVRGRPHGMLPWITLPLLGRLVEQLMVPGDHLLLDADPARWLRIERESDGLSITVADGPGTATRIVSIDLHAVDAAAVAGAAWSWIVPEAHWEARLEAINSPRRRRDRDQSELS